MSAEHSPLSPLQWRLQIYTRLRSAMDMQDNHAIEQILQQYSYMFIEPAPHYLVKQSGLPQLSPFEATITLDSTFAYTFDDAAKPTLSSTPTSQPRAIFVDDHPLFYAVKTNNADAVRSLLSNSCPILYQVVEQHSIFITPLAIAVQNQFYEIVQLLVDNNADPTLQECAIAPYDELITHSFPLLEAIKLCDKRLLDILLLHTESDAQRQANFESKVGKKQQQQQQESTDKDKPRQLSIDAATVLVGTGGGANKAISVEQRRQLIKSQGMIHTPIYTAFMSGGLDMVKTVVQDYGFDVSQVNLQGLNCIDELCYNWIDPKLRRILATSHYFNAEAILWLQQKHHVFTFLFAKQSAVQSAEAQKRADDAKGKGFVEPSKSKVNKLDVDRFAKGPMGLNSRNDPGLQVFHAGKNTSTTFLANWRVAHVTLFMHSLQPFLQSQQHIDLLVQTMNTTGSNLSGGQSAPSFDKVNIRYSQVFDSNPGSTAPPPPQPISPITEESRVWIVPTEIAQTSLKTILTALSPPNAMIFAILTQRFDIMLQLILQYISKTKLLNSIVSPTTLVLMASTGWLRGLKLLFTLVDRPIIVNSARGISTTCYNAIAPALTASTNTALIDTKALLTSNIQRPAHLLDIALSTTSTSTWMALKGICQKYKFMVEDIFPADSLRRERELIPQQIYINHTVRHDLCNKYPELSQQADAFTRTGSTPTLSTRSVSSKSSPVAGASSSVEQVAQQYRPVLPPWVNTPESLQRIQDGTLVNIIHEYVLTELSRRETTASAGDINKAQSADAGEDSFRKSMTAGAPISSDPHSQLQRRGSTILLSETGTTTKNAHLHQGFGLDILYFALTQGDWNTLLLLFRDFFIPMKNCAFFVIHESVFEPIKHLKRLQLQQKELLDISNLSLLFCILFSDQLTPPEMTSGPDIFPQTPTSSNTKAKAFSFGSDTEHTPRVPSQSGTKVTPTSPRAGLQTPRLAPPTAKKKEPTHPPINQAEFNINSCIPQWVYTIFQCDLLYYLLTNQVNPDHQNELLTSKGERTGIPLVLYVSLLQELVDPQTQKVTEVAEGQKLDALQQQHLRKTIMLEGKCSNMPNVEKLSYKADYDVRNGTYNITHVPQTITDPTTGKQISGKTSKHSYSCALSSNTLATVKKSIFFDNFVQSSAAQQLFWDHWFGHHPKYAQYKQISLISTKLSLLHTKFAPLMQKHSSTTEYRLVIWYLTSLRQALVYQYIVDTLNPTLLSYCVDILEHVIPQTAAKLGLGNYNKNHVVNITTQTPFLYSALTNVIPLTFNKYYNMLTTNGCNFVDMVHVVQGIAKPIFLNIAQVAQIHHVPKESKLEPPAHSEALEVEQLAKGPILAAQEQESKKGPVYTMKTVHGYVRRVTQLYLGIQQYHPLPLNQGSSAASSKNTPRLNIVPADIVRLTTNTTVLNQIQHNQLNSLHFTRQFHVDSSDFNIPIQPPTTTFPQVQELAPLLPENEPTIELTNTKTNYFLNEPMAIPTEFAASEKARLTAIRDKQPKAIKPDYLNASKVLVAEGTVTTTTTFVPTNDAARALVAESKQPLALKELNFDDVSSIKSTTPRQLLVEDTVQAGRVPSSSSDCASPQDEQPKAVDPRAARVHKKIEQLVKLDNNQDDIEIVAPEEPAPTQASPAIPSRPHKTAEPAHDAALPTSPAGVAPIKPTRPKKVHPSKAPRQAQQELGADDEACEIPMDGPLPPPNPPPKQNKKGKKGAKNDKTVQKAQEPPKNAPKTEAAPAVEEPKAEEVPVVAETQVVEESKVDDALVEEPKAEEPRVVEEPKVEETPVVEELKTEEVPVIEEPKVEEVLVETQLELVVVESKVDDVPAEKPAETPPEEVKHDVAPVADAPVEDKPVEPEPEPKVEEVQPTEPTLNVEAAPVVEAKPEEIPVVEQSKVEPVTEQPKAEETPVVEEPQGEDKPVEKTNNKAAEGTQSSPKSVTLGLSVKIEDSEVAEHPLPISSLNDPSVEEQAEKDRQLFELQQPYFNAQQLSIIASPTGKLGKDGQSAQTTPLSASTHLNARHFPRSQGPLDSLSIQQPLSNISQSNFMAGGNYTTIGHLFPFITPVTSSLIPSSSIPHNEHATCSVIPSTSRLTYPTHRVQQTKSSRYNPYLSSLYAAHRRSFTMLHLTRNNYLTWSDRDNFARLIPSFYSTDDTQKQLELTKTYFITLTRYYDFMIVTHDQMRRDYKDMAKSSIDPETKQKKDKSQQQYEKNIIDNMMKVREDLDASRATLNKQCQTLLGSSLEELKKQSAFTNSLNERDQKKQDDMLKEHERKNTSILRRMSQAVSKPFTASKKEENVQHIEKNVNSGFLGMSSRRSSVAQSAFSSTANKDTKAQPAQNKLTAIGEDSASTSRPVASIPQTPTASAAPNQFVSTANDDDWVYISPFEISSVYDEDIAILQSCTHILKILFKQYEQLYNNNIALNPGLTLKALVPQHFVHVVISLLLQIEHVSYAMNIYAKLCKHPLWRALFSNLDAHNFKILSLQDCLALSTIGSLEPNSPSVETNGIVFNEQPALVDMTTMTKNDVDNLLTNLTQCPHKNINLLTTLALFQFKSYIYKREELLTQHAARKVAKVDPSPQDSSADSARSSESADIGEDKKLVLAPGILHHEQQKQQQEAKLSKTADPAQGIYRRASVGFIVDALQDNNTIQYDLSTLFSTNLSIKTILPMHLNTCVGLLFTQPVNNTPLTSLPLHSIKHIAANPQFLQMLLKNGLNIHHTNDMGVSFLSLCIQYYIQLKHTLNTEASLPTINSQVITNIRKDTENVEQLIIFLLTDFDASLFTSNFALHANASTPTPFHLILLHQLVDLLNYIKMVAPVKLVPPHLWDDKYTPMVNTLLITPYSGSIQQHQQDNNTYSIAHFPVISEDVKQWLSLTPIEYPTMQTMLSDIVAWGDAVGTYKANQSLIHHNLTLNAANFSTWLQTHNTAARLAQLSAIDDVEDSLILRYLPVTFNFSSFLAFYLPYAITLDNDTDAQGNVLVGEQTTASYKEILDWNPRRYFDIRVWEQYEIILASYVK